MHNSSGSRILIAAAVALMALPGAQAQAAVTFDLPAQPLADSLKAIAAQSNTNVLFDRSLVAGMRAPALDAQLTPEEAVSKLLEGTGVTHELVNEHTIVLDAIGKVPARATAAPVEPETTEVRSHSLWERFRVAQTPAGANASAAAVTDASPAPMEQVRLEEIVVTAQKRAERLIDVPISIVALGSEELQKRRIGNIDELSLAVPGMFSQSNGSYGRQVYLRGISNLTGSSSLIGMYLDEAPVTSSPPTNQLDLRTYDLERVEVLRGPQGTLYGEGSVGGTIRFITRDPQLQSFAMNADFAAELTEEGAPGQRIQTMLNVPLIEDQLGLRLAGTFEHRGGWIDQPAAGRKDFNDQNLVNVRAKMLWQPLPELRASAMAVIHRNDVAPTIGENADGTFDQVLGLTTTPTGKDDYDLYHLELDYELPWARVMSSSTYTEQDRETRNLARRFYFTPPPTDQVELYYPFYFPGSNNLFSQELRFTSNGAGPWKWTLGGFYRHARSLTDLVIQVGTLAVPGTRVQFRSASDSWAAFGDASYLLGERLTLGAGLRYFEDEQDNSTVIDLGASPAQSGKFHALNPRYYVQYKLGPGFNVYASAAKGFRSGGTNNPGQPPYGPERVWTYELGTKASFAEGRLSTDLAVFHSDYDDYLVIGLRPVAGIPLNFTSNAGNARIRGAELALSFRAADAWTLGLNGSFVDSEVRKIADPTVTSLAVGDRLNVFPRTSFSVSAQRDFNWAGRDGFARLDYNQQGRMIYRNRSLGDNYVSESDVLNILNWNVSLDWSRNLTLGFAAYNLLNERGYTDPFSIEDTAARYRPRTYAIEFGVRLD